MIKLTTVYVGTPYHVNRAYTSTGMLRMRLILIHGTTHISCFHSMTLSLTRFMYKEHQCLLHNVVEDTTSDFLLLWYLCKCPGTA